MPSRDIRDELTGGAGVSPETLPSQVSPADFLIVPDAQRQRVAVELVLSDFEASKKAKDERDYGTTAKGEKLSFDAWRKQLIDLYFGRREPKTDPWRFCSNRSLMISMAIVEVLHARVFPAVYDEELTHFRAGDSLDVDKAERVERLMFWWIRIRAKLREFFDRWSRHIIAYGSCLTKTSWDVVLLDKGQMSQGAPVTDEQGNPVTNQDGTPAVMPGEKILERFEKTVSMIIPPEDVFLLPGASDIQRDPVMIRHKYLYRDLEEMEREGLAVNVTTASQEGIVPLRDILPVSSPAGGESLSPEESAELKNIKLRNETVECVEWYGAIDLDGDSYPEPVRLLVFPLHRIYLSGVQAKDLSKRGMRHLDLTMYLPRLDEPQGLFGLGVLEQVKEHALELDAIFNQFTDANTIGIMRPIFYDPAGELDAGALKLAPNKAIPVPNPSQNILVPNFQMQTQQLILAIRLVLEFIERLTAASAYVMGKESEIVGGSGTATRTLAITQSAEQRFSVPIERLREGSARIITQHLDLVQKNLPPDLESKILGDKGDPLFGENELSQESISGEFDAYLLPDHSFGSKDAKRQLSQMLYQILTQNILVATDPVKLYKTTAFVLKAHGENPEEFLGPDPGPVAPQTPEDEHALILQGDFSVVRPTLTQNHLEHIMAHEEFLASPEVQSLPPLQQTQVISFVQSLIQNHIQMMQAVMAQISQKKQGGQGGANGRRPRETQGAPAIGPEPGVGDLQSPVSQIRAVQRAGEQGTPPTG